MREIILQPGTSIEIDGVMVRAARQADTPSGEPPSVYDPATGLLSLAPACKGSGSHTPPEANEADSAQRDRQTLGGDL